MFEFASSRSHLAEVHDFLSLPSASMLPHYQQTMHLDGEEGSYYLLMQQERIVVIDLSCYLIDFKGQHALPLARIKRIMKANRNVKVGKCIHVF
ncbi:hypothetical protein CK203_103863 [Vitis vinifera]|uniref:Uncharacterized protein n=1 Tax=Vitis vinifera TaxID=29760 RepID=A0A438C6L3_VITVI|nr:hypothetical protein CK203_103863 [Vitis vinifera]